MTWQTILSGLNEMSNIVVAVCTIITVIFAFITIRQNNQQIKISNKHQLFEKRIAGYTLLQETTKLYALYKDVLQDKSPHLLGVPNETFAALTDSTSLSGLHQLAYKEATLQDIIVCKRAINPIVCEATNLKFLFSQTDASIADEFLKQYVELCTILYKLRIDNQSIRLSNSEQPDELMLFECERYNTADVLAKLREAYENLQKHNVLKHMEEEIALICKNKQETVTETHKAVVKSDNLSKTISTNHEKHGSPETTQKFLKHILVTILTGTYVILFVCAAVICIIALPAIGTPQIFTSFFAFFVAGLIYMLARTIYKITNRIKKDSTTSIVDVFAVIGTFVALFEGLSHLAKILIKLF